MNAASLPRTHNLPPFSGKIQQAPLESGKFKQRLSREAALLERSLPVQLCHDLLFHVGTTAFAFTLYNRYSPCYNLEKKEGMCNMADLYDYPDIYDERFTDRANQAYKQHYEKMLAGKDIHSILDCSFGTGCLTFCLAELGYQVSGSDISAPMLEQAAKKARAKGLPVDLTECDFRKLSRHFDKKFDCVMSTGSALAHVSNTDVIKTLHEMDQCLKPGGYLYYDSRNWDSALQSKERFWSAQPFYRQDGVRIGYMQAWDYHDDGTITINIVHTYERDRKIFETKEFQEHLHPFSLDLAKSELEEMGYTQFEVKPCPWFEDRPFSEISWYCLLAKKAI